MSDAAPAGSDPQLLVEAARVFNAAGNDYETAARLVAELALEAVKKFSAAERKDETRAQVRRAAYGDAAALRLSGRVSGGYEAALGLLSEIIGPTDPDPDPDGRLHLLRALANGQKYNEARARGTAAADQALVDLRAAIRRDLGFAVDVRKTPEDKRGLLTANQHFWLPDPGQKDECDLAQVYQEDPAFQALVGAAPAGARPPPPAMPPAPPEAPAPDPGGATP